MLPMWGSGLFLGKSAGRTASAPPQLDVAIDVLSVVYDPRNVRSVTGDSEASSPITVIGLSQFTLSNHRHEAFRLPNWSESHVRVPSRPLVGRQAEPTWVGHIRSSRGVIATNRESLRV